MTDEIQRYNFGGLESNDEGFRRSPEGEWVRYEDHQEIVSNLEHERKFWAWKYSRREDECEELAERIKKLDPDGALER